MRIQKVRLKNYRSILDEEISFDSLTAIVGPNGAGKSAALKALDEFYSTTRTTTLDDFYNRDSTAEIEITVSFGDLTETERDLFAHYLDGSTLSVTKVIDQSRERYHGSRLQDPEFSKIRALGGKSDRRKAYNELREQDAYKELPTVRSAEDAEAALAAWEATHANRLQLIRDDGKFFGFRQVGQSRLERFTRFVLVPAVRHAEQDAADSRGSAIYQLMELVVRSTLERSSAFAEFRNRVRGEYATILDPERIPQLGELGARLTDILRNYVPSAAVLLDWIVADQLNFPLPKAQVRLREDNFDAPVDKVGHGLQRAFILSLLQGLAGALGDEPAQPAEDGEETGSIPAETPPDMILAIEEPELYQHPNRQRHLARILQQLSDGTIPGVARRTQVIYCTHSPLFLDIANFECVRRFQKAPNPADGTMPLVTQVQSADPAAVAQTLEGVQDRAPSTPFTANSLKVRLATVMTPSVNEGFFGEVVALVEGEEDRAALLGCAELTGVDLEAKGIAVVACSGKTNIDRPFLVFSALGIPTYVVFDSDSDNLPEGHPETNRALQRLLGCEVIEDFPSTRVLERFAVVDPNLTELLKARCGVELHASLADEFCAEHGYRRHEDCWKSPRFVAELLRRAEATNAQCDELYSIVRLLVGLVPDRGTVGSYQSPAGR
jgi:predicted ATPase